MLFGLVAKYEKIRRMKKKTCVKVLAQLDQQRVSRSVCHAANIAKCMLNLGRSAGKQFVINWSLSFRNNPKRRGQFKKQTIVSQWGQHFFCNN